MLFSVIVNSSGARAGGHPRRARRVAAPDGDHRHEAAARCRECAPSPSPAGLRDLDRPGRRPRSRRTAGTGTSRPRRSRARPTARRTRTRPANTTLPIARAERARATCVSSVTMRCGSTPRAARTASPTSRSTTGPDAGLELVDRGDDHFVEAAGLLFDEARDLAIGRRLPQRQERKRQRDAGDEADGRRRRRRAGCLPARSARPRAGRPSAWRRRPTRRAIQARRNARRDQRARTLARMARSSLDRSAINDATPRCSLRHPGIAALRSFAGRPALRPRGPPASPPVRPATSADDLRSSRAAFVASTSPARVVRSMAFVNSSTVVAAGFDSPHFDRVTACRRRQARLCVRYRAVSTANGTNAGFSGKPAPLVVQIRREHDQPPLPRPPAPSAPHRRPKNAPAPFGPPDPLDAGAARLGRRRARPDGFRNGRKMG